MTKIIVKNPPNDSLLSQLVALYSVFTQFEEKTSTLFDLSQLTSTMPLLLLPLAAYIHDNNNDFILPNDKKAKSYLSAVKFPVGARFSKELQKDSSPIIFLNKSFNIEKREDIVSLFEENLFITLGKVVGTRGAISYPISELVTNIFEHSKKNEGWILSKLNKDQKCLDLCILDRGRGFKKTYKEEKNLELTHREALGEAMMGNSVKSDYERGFGIRTSKRVVCEGLGGSFLILSGNVSLFADKTKEEIINLDKFNWNGVIISYRIPIPHEAISITRYLE